MPNTDAVATLARALREGITHPGDNQTPAKVLHLPPLRSTGIPAEMAQEFAAQAGFASNDTDQLLAEGLVNELQQAGLAIIPAAELDALRTQAADAPDGIRTVTLHTRCDVQLTDPIARLSIGKTNQVVIDCRLLGALAHRPAECPHKAN